jgi:lysophospholipase L1-like esterase
MNKIFFCFVMFFGFHFLKISNLAKPTLYKPDNKCIRYVGRIDFADPLRPRLSSSGAFFQVKFRGSSCELLLEDQHINNYSYIVAVIDGEYKGRIKINSKQTNYLVAQNLKNSDHTLLICKATEASNGYIAFFGIVCEKLLPNDPPPPRKIEFIGNSITCGMAMDLSEVPCGAGQWYDQHNAYLAYGPLLARELNADWLLSSVSGMGMTRNWNSPGPTMPQVYGNLYLNTDSTVKWDQDRYVADLITIALGTNDFSEGDGSYDRGRLDSTQFVNDYINFIKYIRQRNHQASIYCLSSPAVSPESSTLLVKYLTAIVKHMKEIEKDQKIYQYNFSTSYNKGCNGHPDKNEHELMAAELLPYLKKIMNIAK